MHLNDGDFNRSSMSQPPEAGRAVQLQQRGLAELQTTKPLHHRSWLHSPFSLATALAGLHWPVPPLPAPWQY